MNRLLTKSYDCFSKNHHKNPLVHAVEVSVYPFKLVTPGEKVKEAN